MIVFGATQLLACSAKFFAFAPKLEKIALFVSGQPYLGPLPHCVTALFSSRRRRTGHRMVIRPLHRETPLSELQKGAFFCLSYTFIFPKVPIPASNRAQVVAFTAFLDGDGRPTPHRHFFLKRSGVLFLPRFVCSKKRTWYGSSRKRVARVLSFAFLSFSFSLFLSLSRPRARE